MFVRHLSPDAASVAVTWRIVSEIALFFPGCSSACCVDSDETEGDNNATHKASDTKI